MPVNIHGKEYKTVAERLNEFQKKYPKSSVETEVITHGDDCLVKAKVTARGGPEDVVRIATGHALETKGSAGINKTSHVENAETSAVGRALAFLGFAGTEIASADEVATAIKQQGTPAPKAPGKTASDPSACVSCSKTDLSQKIIDFSMKNFDRVLCMDCQDKVRKAQEATQ